MSGSEHARPVFVSPAQREFLGALLATLPDPAKPYYGHLIDLLAAWDAAPADPAEAAREAILLHTAGNYLTMERSGKAAEAVLRALGKDNT